MLTTGIPENGRGCSRKRQTGQALIYGMFVTVASVVALFFLFNTGQLSRDKTKLVNTSDAVAYSAGVMHARTLNYEAYANRAMLANTVAIAQLVSLSSWVEHVNNMASYGYVLNNPKFALYYPAYYTATYAGTTLQSSLNESGALEKLAKASDQIIRTALMGAQQVAYIGLVPARLAVMNEVAQANYKDDGTVTVDPLSLTGKEFYDFVSKYSGDERKRFAKVAEIAANRDKFVPKRSWSLPGLWADCGTATATGRVDWLDRRGGTNLIGLDEWKAMDTLSEKKWVPKNKTDVNCSAIAETPAAWGSRDAADNSGAGIDPTLHDYAMLVNPSASVMSMVSSSSNWGYSGMPNFYDLSQEALEAEDPRLVFAVRLRRDKAQIATSEGRSEIKQSGSGTRAGLALNNFQAKPAGGNEFISISASEVYFERFGDSKDNLYGKEQGRPREIGSLFNPFWQVRLVASDSAVRTAQAMQGVVLP